MFSSAALTMALTLTLTLLVAPTSDAFMTTAPTMARRSMSPSVSKTTTSTVQRLPFRSPPFYATTITEQEQQLQAGGNDTAVTVAAVKVNATESVTTMTTETTTETTAATTLTPAVSLETKEIKRVLTDADVDAEAAKAAQELIDDGCEIEPSTGAPLDELCVDEVRKTSVKNKLEGSIQKAMKQLKDEDATVDDIDMDMDVDVDMDVDLGLDSDDDKEKEKKREAKKEEKKTRWWVLKKGEDKEEIKEEDEPLLEKVFQGDTLEQGWESRGNRASLRRNAEIWKFALKCVFRALKPRKLRKKGASDEEIKQAQVDAATFIRDGLLTLGPTFVKLGQVISTRTDVLPKTYTDVLKTLQDEVPAFSGERAKEIVSKELGRPCDAVFTDFSPEPLKAASLGQVHTAKYKGQKVAIKVQRAGLKELFDVDLKNLKKLAVLLDKFDPKTDGADRDWVSIYEESERLLYLEIDYLNEASNCERFAEDFKDVPYVRVPNVYRDLTTPRVLTMEFVESFKLTDLERIDALGLNREVIARHTADAFLRQIIETSYFHCDPHPGNLCVDNKGNLVYYDFGMMDELKPNVREGFRKFCTALFKGGPTIDDIALSKNAKLLVDGVEEAGVLARGADRLAVEKLARFFMRSFKDKQLGKPVGNIKETLGTDLQTLTENNVFRFPSTFTFIFRAFASVEGIGKGLDKDYDIGKLAQPFVEKFTESQQNYGSQAEKNLSLFSKATGLNSKDINTAVTSPRRIAYIEETLRSMESGSLKIRVRSLENEKALERMTLTQKRMESILLASVFLNMAGLASRAALSGTGFAGAAFFGLQAFIANSKVKKFDKTQAKFIQTKFDGEK